MVKFLMILVMFFGFANAQNTELVKFNFGEKATQYQEKSLGLAMLQSLVLPGLGERYLNRDDRSKWFFSAEILGWASLFFTHQYSENQIKRLHSYAYANARAEGLGYSEDDLQLVGEYRFSDRSASVQTSADEGIDQTQDLSRRQQQNDNGELYWDWGMAYEYPNGDPYDNYKDMLRNYRRAQIGWQVSIGLLALNRLVSLLDVFHLYRSGNSKLAVEPIPSPIPGVQLTVKF